MLNQIISICEYQRQCSRYDPIGIEDLCKILMEFDGNLADGFSVQSVCDGVIDHVIRSLKYMLIRESTVPTLINRMKIFMINDGIYDPSVVVDCDTWQNQIFTTLKYRDFAYPHESDEHLMDTYALTQDERNTRNRKRIDKQFLDFLSDVRRDHLVGPLVSISKLIEAFNETKTCKAYICDFVPWSINIIDHLCGLLTETFSMALMETDWGDVILAKFMDADEYEHAQFRTWHETRFNLMHPPSQWHLQYKNIQKEHWEDYHRSERIKYVIEEDEKYATYQIERISGEFAKMCDDSGKICKLIKY